MVIEHEDNYDEEKEKVKVLSNSKVDFILGFFKDYYEKRSVKGGHVILILIFLMRNPSSYREFDRGSFNFC